MNRKKYGNGIAVKRDSKTTNADKKEKQYKRTSKKLLLSGFLAVLLIVGIFLIVSFLNPNNPLNVKINPVDAFENAVNENNYAEAAKIYHEDIIGNENSKNEIVDFLRSRIESIKKDFVENKVEYDAVITQLDVIEKIFEKTGLELPEITSAKNEINSLNDSRNAFKKGMEFLNNNKYKEALDELKKVIREDENYNKAQELIEKYKNDYKSIVLKEAEAAANSNNYDRALSMINDALALIPGDSELSGKKADYEKLNEEKKAAERKEKMKELEKDQEVTVENISTFVDTEDNTYISIIIKNNTSKTIKKYIVGWMGFDEAGNPVKTGWLLPDYLKEGYVEANVQPGMSFGLENCWRISNDPTPEAKQFLACVSMVEYEDGSRWDNPYYDYWVEEFRGKPLH